MSKDNGPVRGLRGDPGKGTTTIPPNDGDLRQHNNDTGKYNESNTVVQGDTKGFGSGTSFPAEDAPVWLDGLSIDKDATNRVDGFGNETNSDPMFDRFKHELDSMSDIDANKGGGTNHADSVSSDGMGGDRSSTTKSDPMFERYPSADSDDDDVGSKTGSAHYPE